MATLAALDCARDVVRSTPLERLAPRDAREYLKLARDLRADEPRDVARVGAHLLNRYRGSLTEDELWTITEQTVVAAIAVGAPASAAPAVAALRSRFPDSRRADALTALYLEATGASADADALLAAGLEAAPDAAPLLKRRAATLRGRGDAAGAVKALVAYLDAFQTDGDAWAALGDWYVAAGDAGRAAFCYEEGVLHTPTSAAAHARLADALATAAGAKGGTGAASRAARASARAHYATAAALAGGDGCARALWGLVACEAAGAKGGATEDKDNAAKLAAAALVKRYGEEAPGKAAMVQAALKALGVAPAKP